LGGRRVDANPAFAANIRDVEITIAVECQRYRFVDAFDDPVLFLLLLLALFVEQKRLGIFLRKTRGIEAGLIYLVGLDVIIDTL